MTRIMPMPVPHPVWKSDEGGYPTELKVSFSNGKVRPYVPKMDFLQPKPQTISRRELNRLFKENPDGYQPKHAKK